MNPAVALIEQAVSEEFVALLIAKNRCGPNLPVEEILHRYAIPLADFETMLRSPQFVAAVKRHVAELTASGFGVVEKSAILHEAGLPIVYEILADKAQPAIARLKAHEILGTVSGKGERPSTTVNVNAAGGAGAYQLVINLGGTQGLQTLRAPAATRSEMEKLVSDVVDATEPAPDQPAVDEIDPDYA